MGTGYESNNLVTRAIGLLIRAGRVYQQFRDSLPGRIITYYSLPRLKRRKKKDRNAL